MTATEATAAASGERPLAVALAQATSDWKGIATLLATAATIPVQFYALKTAFQLPPFWSGVGSVAPVFIFLAFYLFPALRAAQDQKKLEDFGIHGEPPPPGYFRLTPYDADDRIKFGRPDGAEAEVLKWIQRSKEPLLYLVGLSGVGKSSLLSAHVIPELKESAWVVIEARPYDDPMGAITAALRQPGAIWKQPPDETDVRTLIERAANTAGRADKRLFIVLDQFEEVLILFGEEERKPFAEVLKGLSERPIENLTVLLSLRSDYVADLEALPIRPPTLGSNWFEVKRFTPAAARAFIERSALKPGPRLIDQILQEAAEIEDSVDRVRPVVINMYGLVLASFKGRLPADLVATRLLSGYVRRSLNRPELKDVARAVVAPLVTDVGTKRARPLDDIANAASVTKPRARGALLYLAQDGLVRAVDKAGQRWEIAHDFVARLILPLLEAARATWWDRVRPWLAPGAIAAWAVMVVLGALIYPAWYEGYQASLRVQLGEVGLDWIRLPSEEGMEFRYNGKPVTEAQLSEAFLRLSKVHPPVARLSSGEGFPQDAFKRMQPLPETLVQLDLSNSRGLTSVGGMPNLPALTTLNLNGTGMTSLAGMSSPPALTTLNLNGTRLTSLAGMPDLQALTTLSLDHHTHLTSLAGMPSLPALTTLNLNHTGLTSLAGMPSLPALTTLNLDETDLRSLAGMPNLPALTTLNLNDTSLRSLADMPRLSALTALNLHSASLRSLAGMPSLPALTTLDLRFARLTSLAGMPTLPGLTALYLDGAQLTSLEGLPERMQLKTLGLSILKLAKPLDLASLAAYAISLERLTLTRTPVLDDNYAPLAQLTKLKYIDVGQSTIKDLSVLAQLRELEEIYLRNSFNLNLTPLADLPALKTIYLSASAKGSVTLPSALASKVRWQ